MAFRKNNKIRVRNTIPVKPNIINILNLSILKIKNKNVFFFDGELKNNQQALLLL